MKITITIECETPGEAHAHLTDIRTRVHRELEEVDLLNPNGFKKIDFEDDNCYGSHSVEISDDLT